jgi:hypothetical protein
MSNNLPITWKNKNIVAVTNTTDENFLLNLDSGRLRLDAGRTVRVTSRALEHHEVSALISAGKLKIQPFKARKGQYRKPDLR